VKLLEPGETISPAILALQLPGPPAEAWLHHLEARRVLTSVGSACQSHKGVVSPAALALGIGDVAAKQLLRVSFARTTTMPEVLAACAALSEVERALGASAR
jgi:cysteine desulfurase